MHCGLLLHLEACNVQTRLTSPSLSMLPMLLRVPCYANADVLPAKTQHARQCLWKSWVPRSSFAARGNQWDANWWTVFPNAELLSLQAMLPPTGRNCRCCSSRHQQRQQQKTTTTTTATMQRECGGRTAKATFTSSKNNETNNSTK